MYERYGLYVLLTPNLIQVGHVEKLSIATCSILSQEPHLHYEIRKDRKPLDPVEYLP